MVHLLQKQIPALSFIQPCSNPIFKIKKQPSRKAARLSSYTNLIAGRLLSSRAYFLFRLTIAIKGLQLIKSPTIFQYITRIIFFLATIKVPRVQVSDPSMMPTCRGSCPHEPALSYIAFPMWFKNPKSSTSVS